MPLSSGLNSKENHEMKIIILCIAVFLVLFYAVMSSKAKKGEPYSLKDFILEIFNHTGDSRNFKR